VLISPGGEKEGRGRVVMRGNCGGLDQPGERGGSVVQGTRAGEAWSAADRLGRSVAGDG